MGKITVETCEIEGLKVITPTVFGLPVRRLLLPHLPRFYEEVHGLRIHR